MSARPIAFALLSGLLVVARAPAQSLGLPLTNSGVSAGVTLAAEIGFADEHLDFGDPDDGKAKTIGASVAVGFDKIGFVAMLSRWEPRNGEEAIWAPGVSGSLRVLGGPGRPLRMVALVGVSHWSSGGYSTTRVPLSLGIALAIPSSGISITPWIAPRFDIQREVGGFDDITEAFGGRFGISGGVEIGLLRGISARVAYDRAWDQYKDPAIFSIGVGVRP